MNFLWITGRCWPLHWLGGMLMWPGLSKGGAGGLSPTDAVMLMNREKSSGDRYVSEPMSLLPVTSVRPKTFPCRSSKLSCPLR